ncbi:arsenate reductase (glutaredoxin) [Nisaea acidiphila]|uniref:Arsenate reductase n=1 Tax=Nisaea acidiphila TaxID=1862145 RepID=A0A9J7AU19_9PROT|nr:arsenate reductase (glutaredoxin) [Nisaea acidiphila]UUX49985.1 arsenate reductase (glutaredoxin) [Nisaea acidiphila]
MSVVIYHNPRCSKSRQTLQLLRDKGIEPEIRDYLKEPPSAAELEELLRLLDLEPRALMRKKEAPYKELELADNGKSQNELVAAMNAHPVLIERPVVIANGKAALGRPPEAVLKIL